MGKKNNRNTKSKIVSAAWKLFYEQGYDNTTVEEIVEESKTSKGSFYHYFSGKDMLLGTLCDLFDDKYEELMDEIPPEMDSFEKLMYLNQELFRMIEDTVPIELVTTLYSSQLTTTGNRPLMDQKRIYFKLLQRIIQEGQARGVIRNDITPKKFLKAYALCERAFIYDWCLCNGEYSLTQYSQELMPMFLSGFRTASAQKTE